VLDQSFDVALEHVRWARKHGLGARDVLEAIGESPTGPVTWDIVIGRLAWHWRMLHESREM
jgi:hypothetical protein